MADRLRSAESRAQQAERDAWTAREQSADAEARMQTLTEEVDQLREQAEASAPSNAEEHLRTAYAEACANEPGLTPQAFAKRVIAQRIVAETLGGAEAGAE
jgi:hypothetical protein